MTKYADHNMQELMNQLYGVQPEPPKIDPALRQVLPYQQMISKKIWPYSEIIDAEFEIIKEPT